MRIKEEIVAIRKMLEMAKDFEAQVVLDFFYTIRENMDMGLEEIVLLITDEWKD